MTALEKGLQWERALDLFDEMKSKGLAVTVSLVCVGCHGGMCLSISENLTPIYIILLSLSA